MPTQHWCLEVKPVFFCLDVTEIYPFYRIKLDTPSTTLTIIETFFSPFLSDLLSILFFKRNAHKSLAKQTAMRAGLASYSQAAAVWAAHILSWCLNAACHHNNRCKPLVITPHKSCISFFRLIVFYYTTLCRNESVCASASAGFRQAELSLVLSKQTVECSSFCLEQNMEMMSL